MKQIKLIITYKLSTVEKNVHVCPLLMVILC